MKTSLIENLRLIFSVLTRFNIPEVKMDKASWPKSMGFAPLCGYAVAVPTILPAILLNTLAIKLSPILLAAWSVVCLVYLTGAMHLDGLADICDGFGCHADREKRLKIMHDPGVGTFGIAGLIMILILKFASIFVIYKQNSVFELAAIVVLARTFLTFAAFISSPAEEKGLGKLVIGKILPRTLLLSIILSIPCFLFLNIWIACFFMLFAALIFRKKSYSLIGGLTGDGLGAICEITETIGLFTVAVCSSIL